MLKPAFYYQNELQEEYARILSEPKYMFYFEDIWDYELSVQKSNYDKIQLVSIDNEGRVIGYFAANIDRTSNAATSLEVINFTPTVNRTFSTDFHHFISDLTGKYGLRKVSFEAISESPAQKLYDKHLEKYNGRKVGVKQKEAKLNDGKWYDVCLYELFPIKNAIKFDV